MKIVTHLRQEAARLFGVGVAVGLSTTSSLAVAQVAMPAQPNAMASTLTPPAPPPSTALSTLSMATTTLSTSSLSRAIFAPVAPGPTLSPQLSAEIDHEIATSKAHTAPTPAPSDPTSETRAQIPPASLTHALSGQASPMFDHEIATSVAHTLATPAPSGRTSLTGARIAAASLMHVLPGQTSPAITPIELPPAAPAPSDQKSQTGAQITPASLTHALPGQVSAGVDADALPTDESVSFQSPLPGYSVNSRFGLRRLSFEPHARRHEGVDIAAPTGSPVHATADGYVSRTGRSGSYGRFVEVTHADGLTSFYAHMSRTARLEPGMKVSAGDVVGYVGSTGRATGPHLHFEIREDGRALNPEAFMDHVFASAADLPLTSAHMTLAHATEIFSHARHPLHELAAWHARRRAAKFRYAADHRVHARLAAG